MSCLDGSLTACSKPASIDQTKQREFRGRHDDSRTLIRRPGEAILEVVIRRLGTGSIDERLIQLRTGRGETRVEVVVGNDVTLNFVKIPTEMPEYSRKIVDCGTGFRRVVSSQCDCSDGCLKDASVITTVECLETASIRRCDLSRFSALFWLWLWKQKISNSITGGNDLALEIEPILICKRLERARWLTHHLIDDRYVALTERFDERRKWNTT
ncbi:hypothetical protein ACFQS4_05500 [Saliphagus sp. GCM10025317]